MTSKTFLLFLSASLTNSCTICPQKLVCFFLCRDSSFATASATCTPMMANAKDFHKSQVVQIPRNLGSFGWQLSSCVCPAIAEEFGRIHIADLFVVPSMLDTLHVSELNHQVQSHVFTRQFEHRNGPQRGMVETPNQAPPEPILELPPPNQISFFPCALGKASELLTGNRTHEVILAIKPF